jgi:hypothetical protein
VSVCGYQSVALKGSSSALSRTREQVEELRDEKEKKKIISSPPVYCKFKEKNEKSITNADTATERAAQEKGLAPIQTL